MNSTALKEAVATGYPREKMYGVWWSGAEPDVKDVGDGAKGYHALALQHFTRWLERAGAAAEATRRHVAAKQAAEQALTVPIRLVIVEAGGRPVAPERLATGRVTLMPLAAGPVSSAILVVPGYRGELLRVDPGPWFARVDLPGYMPAETQRSALAPDEPVWELAAAAQRVTVDLRFTPVNALRAAP